MIFAVSFVTLIGLISLISIDLLELNTMTSVALVISGALSSVTVFGVLASSGKPRNDSFEDYMRSLKDRLDR